MSTSRASSSRYSGSFAGSTSTCSITTIPLNKQLGCSCLVEEEIKGAEGRGSQANPEPGSRGGQLLDGCQCSMERRLDRGLVAGFRLKVSQRSYRHHALTPCLVASVLSAHLVMDGVQELV